MHGSDVIFMPISNGWEEFLVINEVEEIENLEKLENEELIEQKRVIQSILQRKRHLFKKPNAPKNIIEVKVIYVERNPLTEKNFVVKVKRDQVHGLLANYIYDNNYPYFLVKGKKGESMLNDKSLMQHNYFFAKFEKWSKFDNRRRGD